jgi:glycosyltransferase involved in cell wall biosynthesis
VRASIVIPTRNRVALLEKCLSALAKQEMDPGGMEIIVVDDGSTDGTAERVRALAEKLPFATRVLKGGGRGPAAARNLGWRDAKAPIVLFTDDDCEPVPSWAAEMVGFLGSSSDYAGAGGEIRRLRDSLAARFTDDIRCMDHPGDPADVDYLVSANAAYRRAVLEQVRGFDESFPCAGGEDPELSFRVKASGKKLGKAPNAVVLHNHPASIRGVYRMHHRYGRGEFGLARLGIAGETRRDTKTLVRGFRKTVAIYRRRRDLSPSDRLVFGLLNMVRLYAMLMGFRWQAKNAKV